MINPHAESHPHYLAGVVGLDFRRHGSRYTVINLNRTTGVLEVWDHAALNLVRFTSVDVFELWRVS